MVAPINNITFTRVIASLVKMVLLLKLGQGLHHAERVEWRELTPFNRPKKKSSENMSASQREMLTDGARCIIHDNKNSLFKPSRFMLSIYFGALLNRSDLPLLKEQDVLVHCKDRKQILDRSHRVLMKLLENFFSINNAKTSY